MSSMSGFPADEGIATACRVGCSTGASGPGVRHVEKFALRLGRFYATETHNSRLLIMKSYASGLSSIFLF